MLVYTIRRFNLFIITLLVLTFVSYNILRLDPLSPWALEPFMTGWWHYLEQLSQFDLGVNLQGEPILDQILLVFPATLELCFFAMIIALAIGLPIGILAGLRQGKNIDTVISFSAMLGYAAPIFWLALLLIMFVSIHFGLTPVAGRYDQLYEIKHISGFALIDAFLSDAENNLNVFNNVLYHLILPSIVLAIAPTTEVIRLMRSNVADVIKQNYIRAARVRGLNKFQIIWRHILPNAIPPIIPKIGVQLSSMLTYAIITESIFNWPGIGRWLLDALYAQDYPSIAAGVIVVASFVLVVNILSDLIGAILNPVKRKQWNVVK
ncbi:MAG: ABC transporter permease [Vibrio sp.]